MKNTRIAGHGLKHEGKPFEWSARDGRYVRILTVHGKTGVGMCECGEVSAVLATDGERKRWHRAHKDGMA